MQFYFSLTSAKHLIKPKTLKNGTYCSSACAGHNELELGECLSHKKDAAQLSTMDLQTKVV